jgi:hypothetical protein
MLGVLKIDKPPEKIFITDDPGTDLIKVCKIINKYLGIIHEHDSVSRNKIILECQQELLNNDLDDYAEF